MNSFVISFNQNFAKNYLQGFHSRSAFFFFSVKNYFKFPYRLIFSLESIIFQVVVVARFHSITPSLLHVLSNIWKPGGKLPYEKDGDSRWKNLNLTPKGD